MRLLPGQVWKDIDARVNRYVLIQFVCVGGRRVRIKSCNKKGVSPFAARSTEAAVARFGDGLGYEYVGG